MTPSKLLFDAIQSLLAADSATLAPATDANIVSLVINNFTPSQDLVIGDLTLATFTGSAPKAAGTGTQTVYTDPISGERVIQVKEPVGGWTWVCTATPGTPETVYGVILTNDDGTVLLGSQLLDVPVPIVNNGDGFSIAKLWFQFLNQSPY